jgi:3-deoxy-D-manno-octulosonate 8-phosphate phosphatase KdsC-like HAD superfamily phosphatase
MKAIKKKKEGKLIYSSKQEAIKKFNCKILLGFELLNLYRERVAYFYRKKPIYNLYLGL